MYKTFLIRLKITLIKIKIFLMFILKKINKSNLYTISKYDYYSLKNGGSEKNCISIIKNYSTEQCLKHLMLI